MDVTWKEYQKSFLLEPTKLERLLAVMHERLQDPSRTTLRDHFQVFMKANRCDELSSLEEVLAIENSKKYKIERLRILSVAPSSNHTEGDYEIEVDFGIERIPKSNPSNKNPVKMVVIEARSNSPSWNRQTLSQVEEQVERTWLSRTASIVALAAIVSLIVLFFLLQLELRATGSDWANRMWLDNETLDYIQQVDNENRALTETELRQITTQQFRNVLNYHTDQNQNRERTSSTCYFLACRF